MLGLPPPVLVRTCAELLDALLVLGLDAEVPDEPVVLRFILFGDLGRADDVERLCDEATGEVGVGVSE